MLQIFGWARLQSHLPLLPWVSWLPDSCFLGLLGFPIASLLAFGHVDFSLGIVSRRLTECRWCLPNAVSHRSSSEGVRRSARVGIRPLDGAIAAFTMDDDVASDQEAEEQWHHNGSHKPLA
jgi:hypothetical protein